MTTSTNKAYPQIILKALYEESLREVLEAAVKIGLRDIYITSHDFIRGRLNNDYIQFSDRVLEHSEVEKLLKQMTTSDNLTHTTKGRSVNLRYDLQNKQDLNKFLGFRYSISKFTHKKQGEISYDCALRPIPELPPTIEFTGLESDFIQHVLKIKSGLVLMIGATGTGKSATMASLKRFILEGEYHHRILEYSSPIEFRYFGLEWHPSCSIVQHEVSEFGEGGDMVTYEEAIKTSMRKGATWFTIGEMTEAHSFKAALALANTGHIVDSTVHANSVVAGYSRIYNMFPLEERNGIMNDLITETEIMASQRLLDRQGGGMVAIREYLIHTSEVKERLSMALSKSITDLKNEVKACMVESGTSFAQQAEKLFLEGVISQKSAELFT